MPIYQNKDGFYIRQSHGGKLRQLMAVRQDSPDGLYRAEWIVGTERPMNDEAAIHFLNFLRENCGKCCINSNTGLPNGAFLMRQNTLGGQKIELDGLLSYDKFKAIAYNPKSEPVAYSLVRSPWADVEYETKRHDGNGHMVVKSSIEPPKTASQGLAELVKETHHRRGELNPIALSRDLERVFEQFQQSRNK